MKRSTILLAAILVAAILVAVMVFSAADSAQGGISFAYVSDVAGDAIDDKDHKNWIDVDAVSVKVERGPGHGVVGIDLLSVEDSLFIVKKVDGTSPQLMMKLANGTVLDDVRIDFTLASTSHSSAAKNMLTGIWTTLQSRRSIH